MARKTPKRFVKAQVDPIESLAIDTPISKVIDFGEIKQCVQSGYSVGQACEPFTSASEMMESFEQVLPEFNLFTKYVEAFDAFMRGYSAAKKLDRTDVMCLYYATFVPTY